MPPKHGFIDINPNSTFRFLPPVQHSVMNMQLEMDPADVRDRIQAMAAATTFTHPYDMERREPEQRVFRIDVGDMSADEMIERICNMVPPLAAHPTLEFVRKPKVMFGMFRPLDKQLELGNALTK